MKWMIGKYAETLRGCGASRRDLELSVAGLVHESPASFCEELVALGDGLMKGKYMLQGWKNMHPEQHYVHDQIDL